MSLGPWCAAPGWRMPIGYIQENAVCRTGCRSPGLFCKRIVVGVDRRSCNRRESHDPAGRYAFRQQEATCAVEGRLNATFMNWRGSIAAGEASGRCRWIPCL